MSEINDIKIKDLENEGKFHSNLPNVPAKTAEEMKSFFDYIPKEILIPKINEIISYLKEKDLLDQENQEILDSILENIDFALSEKIEIYDYEGLKNRCDNDSLCFVNQDMSLNKEANFMNEEHIESGLFPAVEYIHPCLPCDLQTVEEVIEEANTVGNARIPLFALVKKDIFDFSDWVTSYEKIGIVATVYMINEDVCYIEACCNGEVKTWSIEEFVNGEIYLLDWIESLGIQDELYIRFEDTYFYYNFTGGTISKIATEFDLQKLYYKLLKLKTNFETKLEELQKDFDSLNDFSDVKQAYIKNGMLVCNDSKLEKTAKYIGVDMKKPVVRGEIRFGFEGKTENIFDPDTNPNGNNCTALIITTALGCQHSNHIVKGSWHFGINPICATIEYYDDSVKATCVYKHRFATPLLPDKEYLFRFETYGTKLASGEYVPYMVFTFPEVDDNGKKVFTSVDISLSLDKFNEHNGQYVIFEHFYDNAATCRPYFTGWQVFATNDIQELLSTIAAEKPSMNTNYLRHSFKDSLNGPVTFSQTGQPYSLFSNDMYGGMTLI